jgi:hypothetical protein
MYRLACLAVLAASLIGCSWLAYSRYQRGLPALLDFAAMSGMASTQPLPAIRPPFYRLPPWPGVWLALNAACGFAFGCWVVMRRREPALALLLAMFTPAIVSLLVGQDSLILLAALTGVFLLLESRRTFLAGLLLALLWVKFQFLPAFLLLLVMRREWRALAGFGAASAAILLPVAAQLQLYAASLPQMARSVGFMPCRECMPNLYAFIPSVSIAAIVSATAVLITATQLRRKPLGNAFALAAVTALLASMHAHGYDCGLLFLAVTLAARDSSLFAHKSAGKDACPTLHTKRLRSVAQASLPADHYRALLAGWVLSPLPYLLPYFGSGAWATAARLLPAVTTTLLWLSLLLPGSLQGPLPGSLPASLPGPSRPESDESPPALDGYRTA